ncbi:MAG: hypothetical protein ABDK94_02215 [Atribacterota bacterium]
MGVQNGSCLFLLLLGIISGEVVWLRRVQSIWQSVLINGNAHIEICAEGPGVSVGSLWKLVDFWDDRIEKEIDYAYDLKWGYLNASPLLLGTGCKVYFWVHLPALSFVYGEERILQWFQDNDDLMVKGLGNNGEVWAHVFEISNRFTLGVMEWNMVKTMEVLRMRVSKWERQARLHFIHSPSRREHFCESMANITQEIGRKDDNMEKGIFDFLSLWFFGEEEGIIEEREGLKYKEVEDLVYNWLLAGGRWRSRVEALKILGIWPRRILNHV